MATMNKAAALRNALDALDAFDNALWDADFDIDKVEDPDEFFKRVARKAKKSDSPIQTLFDALEEKLNELLKEEEGSSDPVRNPRRRR